MTVRRLLLVILLAAPARAQVTTVQSAWLEWPELKIAIAPDSAGTYLWLAMDRPGLAHEASRGFSGTFDPTVARAWADDARALLATALSDADTGSARFTTALTSRSGASVYIVRRRRGGHWSDERIMDIEIPGAAPLMFTADERAFREILDSLDAVGRRTTVFESAVRQDSIDEALSHAKGAKVTGRQENRAPRYPEGERMGNREGTVLLSFIVGADGKADMNSIKVIHSPSRAFLRAVLDVLPTHRFDPSRPNGIPRPVRVVQPFMFSLVR